MTRPYAVVEAQEGFEVEDAINLRVPSYEYDKLPSQGAHFRLLQLFPGNHKQLKCDIAIYTLDSPDTPSYRALSYCWQNPRFDDLVISGKRIPPDDDLRLKYQICHPLWCNGKRILISTSLRDALQKVRHSSQPVILWVDALCINQEDLNERASQVLLMQRIYHNALEVCMWLGIEDEFTSSAFQLLSRLQEVSCRPLPQQELYNPQLMEELGLPIFPSTDWEALMRLFERPYFRRIWIVQEMIAAPLNGRLYCGGISPISWITLVEAATFLDRSNWRPSIDMYYGGQNNISFILITLSVGMAWSTGAATPADRLLIRRKAEQTRRFEASDPRDKIFALIGIINDFGHRDLLGEDSAEGHGPPQTITKDGTVHATFKLDERNKSREDIAIEILQNPPYQAIGKLNISLQDVLRGCVRMADVMLHPDEDYTRPSFLQEYGTVTHKSVDGINYISRFRNDFRGVSLDHQRAGDFAWNTLKMFSSGITTYTKLIGDYCETADFSVICNVPEIREEVSRFREGTTWVLECLELKSPSGQAESSKAREMTPIAVGDRKTLDSLEYSVKFERQYPDWAWSAAGWTMPMYERPVEQVYIEYTVKCIQDDEDLDILGQVEDYSFRKLPRIPTWVPDFSVSVVRTQLSIWKACKNIGFYCASGSSKAHPKWSIQESAVIGLSGYEIDEICDLASKESAKNKIVDQPEEWTSMIEKLPAEGPLECHKTEAAWRTLIGDRTSGDEYPAPIEYADHYETLRKMLRINRELDRCRALGEDDMSALMRVCQENGVYPTDIPRLMEETKRFEQSMAKVMLERRLFITKKGYIGAAPLSSQVGDVVYVLAGGHVPFVLRKKPGGQKGAPLRLVGECYVHGLMQGEALRWKDFFWEDVQIL